MKYGITFLVLFIMILLPQSLKAEGVACAFGELARNPATNGLSVYTEFKNDSYSVLPKNNRDWDDLRSFGFFIGVSMRMWRFSLTADSLIRRTENENEGKRTDELYFTIDRNILDFSAGPLSGDLTLGAGLLRLGNLESSLLQKTSHAIYGTFRQMPMDYDSIDTPTAFSGYASGRLASAPAGIPIEFDGSVEVMNTGFTRAQTIFALDLLPGDPHWTVYAGDLFTAGDDSFGTVFASVIDSEAGDYVGTTFRAGNLQTGFAYNIQAGRPAGYAALIYPKPEADHETKTENVHGIPGRSAHRKHSHQENVQGIAHSLESVPWRRKRTVGI